MIWLKFLFPVLFAAVGALLLMHNTGEIADRSEKIGHLEQIKDNLARNLRDSENKHKILFEEYARAQNAERLREMQAQEAMERANQLLATVRELESENEELRAWIAVDHPDNVRLLVNAARARNHHQNRVSGEAPAHQPN